MKYLKQQKGNVLSQSKGFTLIEILLVIAAISILASIVIVAINPARQLGQARDAKRRADVNTLLNSVYQYYIDNNVLPDAADIATSAKEICDNSTTLSACTAAPATGINGIDLSSSVVPTYIVGIPSDTKKVLVTGSCSATGSCYDMFKNSTNRVTVFATSAEQVTTATVTLATTGTGGISISPAQTVFGSGYTAIPPMPAVVYTGCTTQPTTPGTLTATLSGDAITFAVGTGGSGGSGCPAGAATLVYPSPIFVSR